MPRGESSSLRTRPRRRPARHRGAADPALAVRCVRQSAAARVAARRRRVRPLQEEQETASRSSAAVEAINNRPRRLRPTRSNPLRSPSKSQHADRATVHGSAIRAGRCSQEEQEDSRVRPSDDGYGTEQVRWQEHRCSREELSRNSNRAARERPRTLLSSKQEQSSANSMTKCCSKRPARQPQRRSRWRSWRGRGCCRSSGTSFVGYRVGEELANIGVTDGGRAHQRRDGGPAVRRCGDHRRSSHRGGSDARCKSDEGFRDRALRTRGIETEHLPVLRPSSLTEPIPIDGLPVGEETLRRHGAGHARAARRDEQLSRLTLAGPVRRRPGHRGRKRPRSCSLTTRSNRRWGSERDLNRGRRDHGVPAGARASTIGRTP